jgi:site-specific recombinase XerD
MNHKRRTYRLHLAAAEGAVNHYMQRLGDLSNKTRYEHCSTIVNFLAYVRRTCERVQGCSSISQARVLAWMRQVARTAGTDQAAVHFSRVNQFLQAMAASKLISGNPMLAIWSRYGRRGWTGLAWASKGRPFRRRLKSVRVELLFTGDFGRHARRFVDLHRAAGRKYRWVERLLVEVNRFLRGQSVSSARSVTPRLVQAWVHSMTCNQRSRRLKAAALSRFFNYLCGLGVVRSNPVTPMTIESIGPRQTVFKPYIYSPSQIRALFTAAGQLHPGATFRLRPQAVRTVLVLLYTLGLRLGEALRLRIQDVNTVQQMLYIQDSKFHKDRMIPFGPTVAACLQKYLEARCTIFRPVGLQDPLFVGRRRAPLSGSCFRAIFPNLLKAAGITSPPEHGRPRPHDLRHSFAVQRLLRWYEQGVDVQSRLVLLSTFMGHVSIYSTQVYLTVTDNLLAEANKRFYRHFGDTLGQEASS